jgi:hypothetical protein
MWQPEKERMFKVMLFFWEKEADKLIQEDTKTKQRCLFGFCPRIIWQYRRGKELTNKKEQIKRLIETGKELSIGLPALLVFQM